MYPLYFFICLMFSVGMLVGLILLAIFPVDLPLVTKTVKPPRPAVHHRKARSPTKHFASGYWDPPWEDDDEDL
ncbi:MAG: hypothetical protein KIG16_03700 [Eubacteriales bacterium]|nr:hypothetical protein [Eubacteriales bacterium]